MPDENTPHKWVPSPYGHGEWACVYCKATNREIAVIGDPNHCPDAAAWNRRTQEQTNETR
jgi:hypothetical protein